MSKTIYVARNNPDGGMSFLRVPVDEYEWARQHALEIAGDKYTASELELLDHDLKLCFCLRRENVACPTRGHEAFVRIPIYLVDYDMQAERSTAGFRDINLLSRDEAKVRLAEFVVNAVQRSKVSQDDMRRHLLAEKEAIEILDTTAEYIYQQLGRSVAKPDQSHAPEIDMCDALKMDGVVGEYARSIEARLRKQINIP